MKSGHLAGSSRDSQRFRQTTVAQNAARNNGTHTLSPVQPRKPASNSKQASDWGSLQNVAMSTLSFLAVLVWVVLSRKRGVSFQARHTQAPPLFGGAITFILSSLPVFSMAYRGIASVMQSLFLSVASRRSIRLALFLAGITFAPHYAYIFRGITGITEVGSADGYCPVCKGSSGVDALIVDGVLQFKNFADVKDGARADHSYTSATYTVASGYFSFGLPDQHQPEVVLESAFKENECWAFNGQSGQIGIVLSEPTHITHFSVSHSAPATASAPKSLLLWALIPEDFALPHEMTSVLLAQSDRDLWQKRAPSGYKFALFAHVQFDVSLFSNQSFSLPPAITYRSLPVETIVLEVLDNWGSESYTCLYSVRIHGRAGSVPLNMQYTTF